ncbi:MAG: cytochrome P450 [Deinococcota bacterium]
MDVIRESLDTSKAIPAPTGLEHLRIMERAATYINDAVWQLHQTYGKVFAFGMGPIHFVWLVGEDAMRFVLQDEPDAFAMSHEFLLPIGGDTALIASEEPDHLRRRRLVQPAFHKTRLEGLYNLTQTYYQRELDRWQVGEVVNLYERIRPVVLKTICEMLLGRALLDRHPNLVPDIGTMMAFANLPFLAQQFKVPMPFTPWQRFVAARRRVDHLLYAEIEVRKTNPQADTGDVLGMLIDARDETGASLSDREIRDQAVSLVSAGFDTTSAGLTWAVAGLLEHPHIATELQDELASYQAMLSFTELLRLPLLENILKESLRLYPPAPAALRRVVRDTSFGGYALKKGQRVALSIYATHRQEDVFENPLEFKPERWQDAQKTTQVSKFAYLPYGFGARYCIGAGLASLMVKTALVMLMQQVELAPAYARLEETGNTVHPKGGLPVRVVRKYSH